MVMVLFSACTLAVGMLVLLLMEETVGVPMAIILRNYRVRLPGRSRRPRWSLRAIQVSHARTSLTKNRQP